jgi:hypothetical protein
MAPAYQDHLTTYIDVLGFRQLIKGSITDASLCFEIHAQLSQMVTWLEEFGLRERFHSFNFSDLVVRATEITAGDDLGEHVDREAYYIAERQLQMAMKGWFLRGAISIGPLAPKDGVIFGPALVRAYELESTIAVYPRIVIDPLILNRLTGVGSGGWLDYRVTDQDGITFINYLFGVFLRRFSFPDPSERNPWKALDDHRNACFEFLNSESAKNDLRVRQKAVWISNYHNKVMGDLKTRFKGKKEQKQFSQYQVHHPYLV